MPARKAVWVYFISSGKSVGVIWTIYEIAKKLGIEKALSFSWQGQLALWQVIARVQEQGSRLSAVRLGEMYAIADVLKIKRGFDENDLYENLHWIAENQSKIEQSLFRNKSRNPSLFLYDVTSSYLEGTENAFAEWGYNRDKKQGKKQIDKAWEKLYLTAREGLGSLAGISLTADLPFLRTLKI